MQIIPQEHISEQFGDKSADVTVPSNSQAPKFILNVCTESSLMRRLARS